jgi:hypothetical protein
MKSRNAIFGLILVLGLQQGLALPRFAVRTGSRCQACHVDPSGGAMRGPYGLQYGRENLPVSSWADEFAREDLSNLITNFLGVGGDFRTLYYYQQLPDTGSRTNNNAFFEMQGDLYLNFRPAKRINVFLKKGLYSGFEAFGVLRLLPADGYIKVGKFLPDFGTRIDDHTSYIRTYTGFSPALGRPELTGAEVALCPSSFRVVGGFYNAVDGYAGSGGNNKALLGRVEGMFDLAEQAHLGAGVNVFSRENLSGVTTTLYGGFGSFSYGDLTIFAEGDFLRAASPGSTTIGIVTYLEADYMVVSGLDLKLAYDYYDPDKDLQTGSQSRVSFGFEFFPIAGVEVRPIFRVNKETPTEIRNNELDLMLHFYL